MDIEIEQAVQDLFLKKGLTLSVAESCTGGNIASRLTKIPGCSKYFLGSIVAYSNEYKMKFLNVQQETIAAHGAVSSEVVQEMLNGLFQTSSCEYAIAVSGIAGPDGGTPEKPVGTIWCGIGNRSGKRHVWQLRAFGSRQIIIEQTVSALLSELLIEAT